MRRSGSATAAAAATLARHANTCCCAGSPALGLLPGAAASSSTHRSALSSNSSHGGDGSGHYDAAMRRRESCVIRSRHRWSVQEAAAALATTTSRRAPGGVAGASGQGSVAGSVRALSSSFLADAVRETATNHCIDRVVNGGLDGTVPVDKDSPTVEVQDFVYDIDFAQRPSGTSQSLTDGPDPFELVSGELAGLSDGIKSLIGTEHAVLNAAAKYFFELDGGKKIRPTMAKVVILMSQACNSNSRQVRPDVQPGTELVNPLQLRLAEITEMIHAASLFHDDVIDEADTRRGVPSVNKVFGNKLAILAGNFRDFLLARSSMSLARLRSLESVELMSAAIEHLVKGEVLQMRPTEDGGGAFEYYVRKNYYKTGSLMANSCKASAVLGQHDLEVQEVAFEYGKRVGLAFQLVDDILDFEGNAFTLGKPALNDLRQGLATAPVLLAAEQQPGLAKLISRKFRGPGDVDEALELVHRSDGIARAKEVAVVQAEKAMSAILTLHDSPAQNALVQLAHKIVNRNH
ncbi:unnamed protein product [Ectocarpus sp. CCAP 1310/34]|nr:unnamed protein product [Ectocarpus sp. CCAP 1310/34]